MLRVSLKNLWATSGASSARCWRSSWAWRSSAGTLVLGDTLRATFDRLFVETTAGTDVDRPRPGEHQAGW